MKKYILILFCITLAMPTIAQTQEGMKYQAVARDNNGSLLSNTTISIQFTIQSDSKDQYQEIFSGVETNDFGLFTLQIGEGNPQQIGTVTPQFSDINWSEGSKYLQIEVDPANGFNFQLIGLSPFLYVPKAKHADQALKLVPSYLGETSFIVPKTTATATLEQTWVWEENDHLYALFTVDATINWLDAQELARKAKGHLVTVTSAEENQFILNNVLSQSSAQGNIPLGFTDVIMEGNWHWVTGEIGLMDQSNLFSFWQTGQPDNSSGVQHIAMYWNPSSSSTRKWDDNRATNLLFDSVLVELDYSNRP